MTVTYYAVETNYAAYFVSLLVGWFVLFVGILIFGRRFAYFALPLGIAIPLSQLVLAGAWWGLVYAEILAWNVAYWLIPGLVVTGMALLLRRLFVKKI